MTSFAIIASVWALNINFVYNTIGGAKRTPESSPQPHQHPRWSASRSKDSAIPSNRCTAASLWSCLLLSARWLAHLITVILDRHHSRLTSLSSRRRELGWWDTETITVAEEQHLRILAPGTGIRLNPLAPSRTLEQGLDEADRAALSIGPVVLAHDWLDGVRCLVGVIEWDRGDVVVQDMGFYDAVEDVATDKAELTIDRSSSTTSEVPGFTGVVGKGGIGVLEVGDGD